jgi:hypothetical protein
VSVFYFLLLFFAFVLPFWLMVDASSYPCLFIGPPINHLPHNNIFHHVLIILITITALSLAL